MAQVHAAYLEALSSLFERHKRRFGYTDDETLRFVRTTDVISRKDVPPKKSRASKAE